MANRAEAVEAKTAWRATLQRRRGVRGVGIARSGSGYAIRVLVETEADRAGLPTTFRDVPVEVVVVGTVEALT